LPCSDWGTRKGYFRKFFQDGVGILGEVLESQGARIVGFTSVQGYTFENSRAVKGDKFMGFAIDLEKPGVSYR